MCVRLLLPCSCVGTKRKIFPSVAFLSMSRADAIRHCLNMRTHISMWLGNMLCLTYARFLRQRNSVAHSNGRRFECQRNHHHPLQRHKHVSTLVCENSNVGLLLSPPPRTIALQRVDKERIPGSHTPEGRVGGDCKGDWSSANQVLGEIFCVDVTKREGASLVVPSFASFTYSLPGLPCLRLYVVFPRTCLSFLLQSLHLSILPAALAGLFVKDFAFKTRSRTRLHASVTVGVCGLCARVRGRDVGHQKTNLLCNQ